MSELAFSAWNHVTMYKLINDGCINNTRKSTRNNTQTQEMMQKKRNLNFIYQMVDCSFLLDSIN